MMFVVFLLGFLLATCQVNCSENRFLDDNQDFEVDSDLTRDLPPIQNSIQTNNRYKCYSCEPPDCHNTTTTESLHCQHAIQCWKSRTRDSFGVERVSRGCTTSLDQLPILCSPHINKAGHKKRHSSGQFNIECCTGNYCNSGSFPELPIMNEVKLVNSAPFVYLALAVFVTVIVLVCVSIVYYFLFYRQKKRLMSPHNKPQDPETYFLSDDLLRATSAGDSTLREYLEHSVTSGSGSGMPQLIQRTLGKQVSLVEPIGRGRYGGVWRGVWHGENVAVKIFFSRDESSWKRETEIYSTILLRHDNILGYIGSDMISQNSCTQLLLLTHYYPLGSLYDHLNRTAISHLEMFVICSSIVKGLVHLHTEIYGKEGKPSIAHRDLKSKNILVRPNGSCVIADFGLAVIQKQGEAVNAEGNNPKVGTKRYMAPEILDETIDPTCFDALRKADIYSLALVFWEVCRRTRSNGIIEEYKVPFFDCVPSDPSFEDMKKVVCGDNHRPSIPNRWASDPVLDGISKILRECWHQNPNVRLSALRIKKNIHKLSESCKSSKITNYV